MNHDDGQAALDLGDQGPKGPPESRLPDYTTLAVFRSEVELRMRPLDLVDCIVEIDREIRMRETHYPRFVAQGKVTQKAASRQLARLRAARMVLASLTPPRP